MTTSQNSLNRELRVFISSTFRDMQAERDYLVRQVFPVIRKACRERQVEFTEIDLRWGVTREEAEQGKVVRICLEEIDRCRPYFLSLLGERYGWAPHETDLDHKTELLALFPFLENSLKEGLSVTEMEIIHGVINNPEMIDHSFFYLRSLELTELLSQQFSAPYDYKESDLSLSQKLAQLKDKIRKSGLPVRDNYQTVEELGERVKQDLLAVLDSSFPIDETPTPLEAERNAHRMYGRDRCQSYIANSDDLEALDRHLESKRNTPLVVTGESGLGKSALLAYWSGLQLEKNPNQFLIEHYVGISGDADPVAVIRRVMAEIKARYQDPDNLPAKPDEVIRDFPLWLAKVRANDPLILIIDGLNQLESVDTRWLPEFWQANVKAVFSVIPGEQLDQLIKRESSVHTVQVMDLKRREQLIREWLASYRKALSVEQTQRIAQASQSENPLFLKTVLEELRIFGYFEHLDQRITALLTANNSNELFVLVLERLEADFGKEIVSQIMQALWAARRGLSETEVSGITGLNRLVISNFLMAIDVHLAKRGGLLNFFHDYLRQAVGQLYFQDQETATHEHIKLAQYFEQQDLNIRIADELPWQWQQAEEWNALEACISSIPMFEILCEKDDLELLAYWLATGKQDEAGECYTKSLAAWRINNVDDEALAALLVSLGGFLTDRCTCLISAEPICRSALAIYEKILGAEHPDTAISLNNLASLLYNQGKYDQAESLCQRALAIREKILGAEHPDTAINLNYLAHLLSNQGKYDQAEPLYQRALAIQEKILSAEHPNTANSLNNLAVLLKDQGKYDQAEPLYQRALAIREKILGAEHPATATSLNNLAILLKDQGKYDQAEPLYQRALAILEKILGAEHPDTATSLNNLANLYSDQGKYDQAEPLYERALAIREKILGAEHPDTANSLNNLANLYSDQCKYDQAEPLYQRALAIHEKILGAEHPATATSLNNLAFLLSDQGKYDQAEPLYQRALAIREKILGAEHPDTATSLNNLANLYSDQGKYDQAEPLYQRALAILEKILGAEHPHTTTSLKSLAHCLEDQGRYNDAEKLYRHALGICEKKFGHEHEDTAYTYSSLGCLLDEKGIYDEAEKMHRTAFNIRNKILGLDNEDTLYSLDNLTNLLQWNGKNSEAEVFCRQQLTLVEKKYGENHNYTIGAMQKLGAILREQHKYNEAELFLRSAITKQKELIDSDVTLFATSLSALGALLVRTNREDEAKVLYLEALSIREKTLGIDHPRTKLVRDRLSEIND